MRCFLVVVFSLLSVFLPLAAAAGRVVEIGRVPFPCPQLWQSKGAAENRGPIFAVLGGDENVAAVKVQIFEATGSGRHLHFTGLDSCVALVDVSSLQVLSQWESRLRKALAFLKTQEGFMVLGKADNQLILEGPQLNFRWPCVPGLCGAPIFGNIAVLESSAFPIGPLELAGPSADGRHMVTIYRLYPPEEEGKVGTVEEVRNLVGAEEFGQAWLQATDYEGQLKALWDQMTMATRLKAFAFGLDIEKELQRNVEYKKTHLPSTVARFRLDGNRLLLHTQHPWSVALVDLKEGSFHFLVPKSLGQLKPLFAHSWFVPYFAARAGRDALWLLVKGQLAETRESYTKTHPDRPCEFAQKSEEFAVELCHYYADVLMRLEVKEKGEFEVAFWVLGDEETMVRRNVLQIGKKSVDFLEAHPGELVVKRLRF